MAISWPGQRTNQTLNYKTMNDQEEAFVRRFIIEEKQARYIGFLSKPRTRGKFLSELYHRLAFKNSLAVKVPSNACTAVNVEKLLRQKGAGSDAYVMSPDREIDQQWHLLSEALEVVLSTSTEAIVCCQLGELAFYKSETSDWILHHPKRKAVGL